MRIELERLSIAPPPGIEAADVYRVLAVEDSGANPKTMQIGTVTHVRGPTWSLMLKPEKTEGEGLEVLLNAETVELLKGVIRDRFGLLDLSADRLSDETMGDFAMEMLRSLSTLATTTHTISGFTSALVYHLALVGAVDIKPENRDEYANRIAENLRKRLGEIVAMHESRGVLKGALRDMLEKIIRPEGDTDGGPTKH